MTQTVEQQGKAAADAARAECIECGASVTMTRPVIGEIVACRDCGVELEVTAIAPLTFALAPEEAEDWGE